MKWNSMLASSSTRSPSGFRPTPSASTSRSGGESGSPGIGKGMPSPPPEVPQPGVQSPQSESTPRSEEHTSELQSRLHLVCRLLLEKKKQKPARRQKQR